MKELHNIRVRRHRSPILLTAVGLFMFGGTVSASAEDIESEIAAEVGTTEVETTTTEVTPPRTHAHDVIERSEEVLAIVGRLRGLPALAPVTQSVQNRDELRGRLLEMVMEEYGAERIAEDERVLRALGLLTEEQNYLNLTLDLLEDQIAGFYDDATQTLYLMDDGSVAEQEPVMAHELFHAIQDQHWGIAAIRGGGEDYTDVALARTALIEGDALAVMLDYVTGENMPLLEHPALDAMIANMNPSSETLGPDIPPFIWDSLVYPYFGGLSFVTAVLRDGGWEAVNAVYTDGPQSTEQILHPERYIDRDEPTWLDFDAQVDGLTPFYDDVFGEFTLGSVMRDIFDGAIADRAVDSACQGWDGDRLLAFGTPEPGRDVLVHVSVWDSVTDAEQFFVVVNGVAAIWLGDEGLVETESQGAHGQAMTATSPTGSVYFEQWGDLVLWIADTDGGVIDRAPLRAELIDAVWSSLQRGQYPVGF